MEFDARENINVEVQSKFVQHILKGENHGEKVLLPSDCETETVDEGGADFLQLEDVNPYMMHQPLPKTLTFLFDLYFWFIIFIIREEA